MLPDGFLVVAAVVFTVVVAGAFVWVTGGSVFGAGVELVAGAGVCSVSLCDGVVSGAGCELLSELSEETGSVADEFAGLSDEPLSSVEVNELLLSEPPDEFEPWLCEPDESVP